MLQLFSFQIRYVTHSKVGKTLKQSYYILCLKAFKTYREINSSRLHQIALEQKLFKLLNKSPHDDVTG